VRDTQCGPCSANRNYPELGFAEISSDVPEADTGAIPAGNKPLHNARRGCVLDEPCPWPFTANLVVSIALQR
jgi:hypothetical protein